MVFFKSQTQTNESQKMFSRTRSNVIFDVWRE
jgi:hypothetical protein